MKPANDTSKTKALARQRLIFERLLESDQDPQRIFGRQLMSISLACMRRGNKNIETAKEASAMTVANVAEQLYGECEPFSDDQLDEETQIKAFMYKDVKSSTHQLLKGAKLIKPIHKGTRDIVLDQEEEIKLEKELLESLTRVLSERQIEVLTLIAEDYNYLDISQKLGITTSLVGNCAFQARKTLEKYCPAIRAFQENITSATALDFAKLSRQLNIDARTLKLFHNAWLRTQK